MTITGIGCNSGYVSPYGGAALQKYVSGYNPVTGNYEPDKLIKKNKSHTSVGEIIGGAFLAVGTAFAVYKGRNSIGQAYNSLKNSASQAYNNLKQRNITSSIKNGFTNLGNNIKNKYSSIKNKVSSMNIGNTIKTKSGKVWNFIKSIPTKVRNLF